MAYIFLDESGHFDKRANGRYFVVGSFIVESPRRISKSFKSWRQTKFPKKLRRQSEIKFSDRGLKEELKIKTVKFISSLDIRIHYSYFLRENIPFDYWQKNKLQSGLLYTNIIAQTLAMYLPINSLEFRAFCDKRHLHGITTKQFKSILTAGLLPLLPKDTVIQIEMVDSAANTNVQIADWVAGGIACYLEGKKNGEKYFQILKNNILDLKGKQMFEKSWLEEIEETKNPIK